MSFIYSDVIGAHGGWEKQSHPRMRKFDQYYHERLNAYLEVRSDGTWKLFLPVEVQGIQCFKDEPTRVGNDRESLDVLLGELAKQ
jgi:hypothetical protein